MNTPHCTILARRLVAVFLCVATFAVHADQSQRYDYFAANRTLIRNGVQAVLMCNGLFTSHRSLDQVFAQELAYLSNPVGDASGGDYAVETKQRAVRVGDEASGLAVRAAFRSGIGCVVMAPDQTSGDIADLPELTMAAPSGDPTTLAWPHGDNAR